LLLTALLASLLNYCSKISQIRWSYTACHTQ